jgi:hypothetical protein
MTGMTIHIALESTIHIVGIRSWAAIPCFRRRKYAGRGRSQCARRAASASGPKSTDGRAMYTA